jgi:protein-S-isoprenylcysteine O-methyltransferase Ste14
MKNILRHALSFIAPFLMCFIIPGLIIRLESTIPSIPVISRSKNLLIAGAILISLGLYVLIKTIVVFIKVGNGTIMPWDPSKKFILVSPYTFVRNPMILSVIIILVGEAILFGSIGTAVLAGLNLVINTIYFKYSEEPGLVERFGNEYTEYMSNVPRWIPRLKPWKPV